VYIYINVKLWYVVLVWHTGSGMGWPVLVWDAGSEGVAGSEKISGSDYGMRFCYGMPVLRKLPVLILLTLTTSEGLKSILVRP
jgi:hypothetical protein